jgi:hypothetical protein
MAVQPWLVGIVFIDSPFADGIRRESVGDIFRDGVAGSRRGGQQKSHFINIRGISSKIKSVTVTILPGWAWFDSV